MAKKSCSGQALGLGLGALPSLAQAAERLVMKLGDARGRDAEAGGDIPQRDAAEVVQDHNGDLGQRQALQAAQKRAAILPQMNGGIGLGSSRVGQALGQGQIVVTMGIFAAFLQRDELAGLGEGLEGGEIGRGDAQCLRELNLGGFAFELLD